MAEKEEDHAIWTEKYRPQDFSEIKGQKDIVARVKAFVQQKNMPHQLYSGPAGVGKSTLAIVVAKKLFGPQWRQNFIELNASDERGIDIIRVKVKDFARTKAIGDVPFKIIFLDECLDYDSLITIKGSEHIEEVKLGDFEKTPQVLDYQVLSVNDTGERTFVKLINVIKIPHQKEKGFYKIKAHNNEIKITGNHLLITPDGWKSVHDLKVGDLVLCPLPEKRINFYITKEVVNYNLVGLPQEIRKKERYISNSPEKAVIELLASHEDGLTREEITKLSGIASSKLSGILSGYPNEFYISLFHHGLVKKEACRFKLIDEKNRALAKLYNVKREQNCKNQGYIKSQLLDRNLYPMKKEKALAASRIIGHLFSDGCLSLKTKQLFFSGKEEDLKKIKKDINTLGFYTLGNIRHTKWRNGECWSFAESCISLLSLFYSLGAPIGKKTDNYYLIPDWIIQGDIEIKRQFLSTFFGGEGSKPSFQGRTIRPIVVAQAKRLDLKNNLFEYLTQIKKLLFDFGIDSEIRIATNIKNTRKDGTQTLEGKIWIKNSRKNIIRFLQTIGYSYCDYKEKLAKLALQYLLWKENLGKRVYTFRPIPHFEEWLSKYHVGECCYFYITGKEKLSDPEFVYCLQTENQKFISDNLIVHNCDALTREAQQALRRTMENYTTTCRFILSCNYSSKIIDPIQSRCAVFRFKPLDEKDLHQIIERISKDEHLKVTEKAKEALVEISEGDCRRLENVMQSCAAISKNIDEKLVYSLASVAEPKEVIEILKLAIENKFVEARNKLLDTMLNYGLSGLDIIKQIQKQILDLEIDNRKKMELVEKCGEIEFRMTEGSDEFIQLETLLAQFTLASSKQKE